MDVPAQLELCLYDQLDIASLLLVSLLFIVLPTPFLNILRFYSFLVQIRYTANNHILYIYRSGLKLDQVNLLILVKWVTFSPGHADLRIKQRKLGQSVFLF